jgi:hypothetical protein
MPRLGHGSAITLDEIRAAAARIAERSADLPFAFAAVTPADPTRFDYLFADLQHDPAALLPESVATVQHLKELGRAMRDTSPDDKKNSSVPAAYTYLGQFIDHDITLESASATLPQLQHPGLTPLTPQQVKDTLFNTRTATLDLDSVYGVPAARVGQRMKIGSVSLTGSSLPPQKRPDGKTDDNDLPRDMKSPDPRIDRSALIGDPRNDENTIVSQLHLAFLLAHNAIVAQGKSFEDARRLLRQHYQWMVLHDFLKRVCDPAIVDRVIQNGPTFYKAMEEPFFLPVEFSVAAFRFGHTMVRANYNFNENFQLPGAIPASLGFLFTFTALSGQLGFPGNEFDTLPENWIIEWERFFPAGVNVARRFDTQLVEPLFQLTNSLGKPETEGGDDAKRLAVRNLLRGYLLRMPTGQAVAGKLGLTPLTAAEIETAADDPAQVAILQASGFNTRTPLWYYILAEANGSGSQGQHLGPVGSTLLAEIFVGLVQRSEDSILRSSCPWQPTLGSNGRFELPDLLRLAGRLA